MNTGKLQKIFWCCAISLLAFSFVAEASVVLKIVGVNPSKEQKKKVTLKAYLPEEIKPSDVLSKGDLELIYDEQKGAYYVNGEYELEPGETVEEEVELRDIWNVPKEETDVLAKDMEKIFPVLNDTTFKDKAKYLKDRIETNMKKLQESQGQAVVNPQQYISKYREESKLLAEMKSDMESARALLGQIKPIPSVDIWKVFLLVIGFLAVLATVLFVIWQHQAKVIVTPGAQELTEIGTQEGAAPQQRGTQETSEIKPEDIEKIIKDDNET